MPEAEEQDPEGSVALLQFRALSAATEHLDLVAQGEVLEDEWLMRLKARDRERNMM